MRKISVSNRKPSAKSRQRGISLIEVLWASMILAVGIIGAFGAVTTAAFSIYDGGRETIAGEQAQAILERIRNAASYEDLLSYGDSPPAGATTPTPDYVQQNRNAWLAGLQLGGASGIGKGRGSIAISQQGGIPNRLAAITVTVDWDGRKGPNPLTFVTRLSEWP